MDVVGWWVGQLVGAGIWRRATLLGGWKGDQEQGLFQALTRPVCLRLWYDFLEYEINP